MTPRPIHHWKTFWLGLIILLCLCAAWRHSIHRMSHTGFNFTKTGPSITIGQGGGKIAIKWSSFPYASHPHVLSRTTYLGQSSFGTASSFLPDGGYLATFAHWFVILLYTLCWSIYLASRWETTRALTESRTAAEADAATRDPSNNSAR
jgi:hypothetical protein